MLKMYDRTFQNFFDKNTFVCPRPNLLDEAFPLILMTSKFPLSVKLFELKEFFFKPNLKL